MGRDDVLNDDSSAQQNRKLSQHLEILEAVVLPIMTLGRSIKAQVGVKPYLRALDELASRK